MRLEQREKDAKENHKAHKKSCSRQQIFNSFVEFIEIPITICRIAMRLERFEKAHNFAYEMALKEMKVGIVRFADKSN